MRTMVFLHILNKFYCKHSQTPVSLDRQKKKMDINKIQSALQSLKDEQKHIEDYLQNAAAKKKELDKEMNASSNRFPWK